MTDRAARARVTPAVLANKLVGLAEAQLEAVQREAGSQFSWLVLRRDEVTNQLAGFLAKGVHVSAAESRMLTDARQRLAGVDTSIEQELGRQMAAVGQDRRALAASRKAVAPYFAVGGRIPTFIDKRG